MLFDAIYAATGSPSKFPGVPEGTRAAQLPDAGAGSPDGFLGSLGRPPRESACECERSSDLQLGPIMPLMTGPTVDQAISDPNNAIAKLVAGEADDRKVVEELYWRILNRPPAAREIDAAREILQSMEPDHTQVLSQLQAYRIELAPLLARKEEQRQKDIAQAKAEHDAYQQQIAPREAELDRQRQEAIANAEKALQEFEETLPQKVSAWEQKQERTTVWIPLAPADLKASHSAQLTAEKDHSIFASGA